MRALRVLFVANDGMSVGHVTRMLALARELGRRDVPTQRVLATTSQANQLLATGPAIVQLPAPARARAAGLDDATRRRLVKGTLDGVLASFAPDLVVVDTFPTGPHGELALESVAAKKVLVRRATANADDPLLARGLGAYDLAITCEEGVAPLPMRTVAVPPITLFEAHESMSRADARAALALPAESEIFLVTAGGGGDDEGLANAERLAAALFPATVVLAAGPLAPARGSLASQRIRSGVATPMQPYLAAFDGAFSTAGYNTAYELGKAQVPTVFSARPRPFDDQAARAARFAAKGWALASDDVADGVAHVRTRRVPSSIEAGGAARAVDALLSLVGAGA